MLYAGSPIPPLDSASGQQDLFLLGFGELILSTFSVNGNVKAFEANNPFLNDDFNTNYRMSLFANGNLNKYFVINGATVIDSRIDDEYQTADPSVFRLKMSLESTEPLWDNWRFTGETVYDPNRQWEYGNLDLRLLTQPQDNSRLEMMARLYSDHNGYIEGGSLKPSFRDAKFTLYQRSLFGVYADLYGESVGIEAVGGKLDGKTFREGDLVGIRADGTTGPYDLTYAPVTRGSEVVKIETRDRFNETIVLSSRTLIRDKDYTVDYDRGRIILYQPVASETISSDPNFIVITYDYQRYENDELIGARVKASPVEDVQGSFSAFRRYIDQNATGIGYEEPEDLAAADLNFDFDGYGSGYFEIAGSEDPDKNETNQALRAGLKTDIIENMTIRGDYQRIEDQFRSFGNTDLYPTQNQWRLNLAGEYKLTDRQTIFGSFNQFRGLTANGEYNTYDGHRDEKIYAFGYKNGLSDGFGFGVNVERRDVKNNDDPSTEDTQQDRLVLDLGGHLDSVPALHLFGYGLHYEYIKKRNEVAGGTGNTNTNQVAVNLSSEPAKGTRVEVTQKIRLLKDKDLDTWGEREDGTFASARVQLHDNLSSKATLEYKRFTVPGDDLSFWQDDPIKIERSGTIALEYLPLKKLKGLGKFGRYEIEQMFTDSTVCNTSDFILGQATYFMTHHWSFNAETEYTRKVERIDFKSRSKIWDVGLKMNWNKNRFNEFTAGLIRRWQLSDFPPANELKQTSYIILLSGAVSLTHGFYARGSIKDLLLRDILDDEETHIQVELGYENANWYRVSVGFERIENQPDDLNPNDYYRGQGIFIRLLGKF